MGIWEDNVRVLEGRAAAGDLLPEVSREPPTGGRVVVARNPYPTLKVPGEKGRLVTLNSPRRPWEEAAVLAGEAPVQTGRPLVVLGLGLGYHVLALLPRLGPGQRLAVVEKDPEVWQAAMRFMDLRPLLNRPDTVLVVHPKAGAVIRHLRSLGLGNGRPVSLWGHPAALRAVGDFYQEVIKGLVSRPRGAAVRRLGVKKEKLRVLLCNPDYFLILETIRAFRHLGHEVRLVLFDKGRDRGEEVVQRIVAGVRDWPPDLVFTVNHLGLDREGLLLEFFQRLRLPLVSWYVDSPAIILNLYQGPKSELAYIFVWDPTYIPEVKALGFEHVFALPLATDPGIFYPRPRAELKAWRTQVSFVGNSLSGSVEKKLQRLPDSPEFLGIFQRLAKAYRARPFRRLRALLEEAGLSDHPVVTGLSLQELTDLEAGIIWSATRGYRLACVRELAPFEPVIYGDAGWEQSLHGSFTLKAEVSYYEELPLVYGGSDISFNATSLQMKAAVNQRVFDVPAAGGFLLTDFREQLGEVLEVGREVACYREPGEIPELVQFYLKNSAAREGMAARARVRVLAEHTYVHRVTQMLATIRGTV